MFCRHGELSQAMRNRGIEIFMGSSSAAEPGERHTLATDLQALLSVSGVPGNALPEAMVAAHHACTEDAALHHRYRRPFYGAPNLCMCPHLLWCVLSSSHKLMGAHK